MVACCFQFARCGMFSKRLFVNFVRSPNSGPHYIQAPQLISAPAIATPDVDKKKPPMPMSDDQFLALVVQQRAHLTKTVVDPVPKMTGPGERPSPQQPANLEL